MQLFVNELLTGGCPFKELSMSTIVFYEDKFKSKWDNYVNNSPCGTFYHLTGWKNVIEKTFGFKPFYMLALDDKERVRGVLPLFLMRDILKRKYLVSNPSSNYSGVCSSNHGVTVRFLNRAKEIASEYGVQYVEFRHYGNEVFHLPSKVDFVTMVLNMKSGEDGVWKNFLKSTTRNRIRKACRNNLTVDFGKEYLDDFYRVLSTNMRDLGTPIYPKEFFGNILNELDNISDLIVVKYQGNVIGSMLCIYFNNVFCDPWVSTLRQYSGLCPGDFLYWEAIKYSLQKGAVYFDFGRSTVNSGTFNFKKKWGAVPVQLYYQYLFHKTQKIPEVSADGNKYRIAINLWKKLPLVVANTLGPRLIKYLPEL